MNESLTKGHVYCPVNGSLFEPPFHSTPQRCLVVGVLCYDCAAAEDVAITSDYTRWMNGRASPHCCCCCYMYRLVWTGFTSLITLWRTVCFHELIKRLKELKMLVMQGWCPCGCMSSCSHSTNQLMPSAGAETPPWWCWPLTSTMDFCVCCELTAGAPHTGGITQVGCAHSDCGCFCLIWQSTSQRTVMMLDLSIKSIYEGID